MTDPARDCPQPGGSVGDLLPLLGLRITAGQLELRGLTDADLVRLGTLAEAGVHPADRMPFYVPWTDAPAGALARNMAQYHWGHRARFSTAEWSLDLGVWRAGELLGSQGFGAKDYLVTRTGETGSWLGRQHQGMGVGTAMRQALCAFLFDHLDATEITSGAFSDNPASLAVSRKVGYLPNGVRRVQRRRAGRDEMVEVQMLVLTPNRFVRGESIEVEGGAAFRRSIGLPPG